MSHITRRRFLAASIAVVAAAVVPINALRKVSGRSPYDPILKATAVAIEKEIRNASVIRELTYVQFHSISLVDYADPSYANPHTLR